MRLKRTWAKTDSSSNNSSEKKDGSSGQTNYPRTIVRPSRRSTLMSSHERMIRLFFPIRTQPAPFAQVLPRQMIRL